LRLRRGPACAGHSRLLTVGDSCRLLALVECLRFRVVRGVELHVRTLIGVRQSFALRAAIPPVVIALVLIVLDKDAEP